MQGLKSNIRYWGYTVEYMLLVVLGTLFLICVLNGFDNLSGLPNMYLEMISDMGYLYLILVMCMVSFSGALSYFPFTISMGSTRKNSFLGMQIALHLLEAQLVALVLMAKAVLGNIDEFGKTSYMIITLISIMFVSVAMGNFLSAAIMKFNRTVGFVLYFIMIGLFVGGLAVVVGLELDMKDIMPVLTNLIRGPVVFIAAALDAISIAVYYMVVRKIEVRV